jgi:hypothetical protein
VAHAHEPNQPKALALARRFVVPWAAIDAVT